SVEAAARVPAIDLGWVLPRLAADHTSIRSTDRGVQATIGVRRPTWEVGVTLGQVVAVRRISKPDAAVWMGNQVVRRIERFALVIVGDRRERAVVLPANDATVEVFCRKLPPLKVERVAVAVVGRIAEDRNAAVVPDIAVLL